MFHRPGRGLFDFVVAVLCVWAAYYHTPAGALFRRVAAWSLHTRTSARPLLAYYGGGGSGGALWRGRFAGGTAVVPRADVPREAALGYGAWATLTQLPPAHRDATRTVARRYNLEPAVIEAAETGPAQSAKLLSHLKTDLGSEDAAVVAFLLGYEPARYARDRAVAEGGEVGIEQLARQLPPEFEERIALAAQALTLAGAYGLSWPVPERFRISSAFGVRDHPILGTRKLHTGVDVPLPVGTPVRASADGVVRRASEDAINGRVLVIDHGHGVTTAYCHNANLLVKTGEGVTRGQLIAESGNTGRSTGPHLHYQLELGGEPVDPLAFRSPKPNGKAQLAAPRRPVPVSVRKPR